MPRPKVTLHATRHSVLVTEHDDRRLGLFRLTVAPFGPLDVLLWPAASSESLLHPFLCPPSFPTGPCD